MKTNKKIKNNANELYNVCIRKEKLITIKSNCFITEGVNEIVENEHCLNIIELIFNQYDFIKCEIQYWYIIREKNDFFTIECKDYKGKVLNTISNVIIDFYFDYLHLLLKNKTLYLPVEEKFYF
jgi:hypothetical protein